MDDVAPSSGPAPPSARLLTSSGLDIEIRSATPQDRALVVDGFERLSDHSRHNRFFTAIPRLEESMIDRLLDVGPDQLVLVALAPDGDDATNTAIGGAQAIRSRHGGSAAEGATAQGSTAELAVTVIDAYQGQGVGTLLIEALSAVAEHVGITRFEAEVLAVNRPMLAVLRSLAAELRPCADDATVVTARLDTAAVAARLDPVDRAELLGTVLGAGVASSIPLR